MAKITLEELHTILNKPFSECDGYELHIKHLWDKNRTKSLFVLTGLDLSNILGPDKPEEIVSPITKLLLNGLEL
jgi:hypothetical protein